MILGKTPAQLQALLGTLQEDPIGNAVLIATIASWLQFLIPLASSHPKVFEAFTTPSYWYGVPLPKDQQDAMEQWIMECEALPTRPTIYHPQTRSEMEARQREMIEQQQAVNPQPWYAEWKAKQTP